MSKDFQIIQLAIDEGVLKKCSSRLRNQLVGCMHAHNELTILNRTFMFSINSTGDGELHDAAQTVQMWCFLQLLAAKLFETWSMLNERVLKATPADPALSKLTADQNESLEWLKDYFGVTPLKDNAVAFVRNKTAFHYDKLNLEQTVGNLAVRENFIYLAQHPANSLYYLGSALVFRTAFAMIADRARDPTGRSLEQRTKEGVDITTNDANLANFHMHVVLYGLIAGLLDEVLGRPLDTLDQVRINVLDAPPFSKVGMPSFIDIGS